MPENQRDFNQSIRQSIRLQRRGVPAEVRSTATARICHFFEHLTDFKKANRVAGFLAFDGEADPMQLMVAAVEQGKQVFVPTILGKDQPLKFIPWYPNVPLKTNRFGIKELDVPQSEWISGNELDFVINPLVAFDRNCHRLGVGGGYYDRTFQFLNSKSSFDQALSKDQPVSGRPILAGFAFELQRVESIERKPWDVILDWVITERRIYRRFRSL